VFILDALANYAPGPEAQRYHKDGDRRHTHAEGKRERETERKKTGCVGLSAACVRSVCVCCSIIERVIPRLQHSNSAVAMSAMRVIINLLETVGDGAIEEKVGSRLPSPPFSSLLLPSPCTT